MFSHFFDYFKRRCFFLPCWDEVNYQQSKPCKCYGLSLPPSHWIQSRGRASGSANRGVQMCLLNHLSAYQTNTQHFDHREDDSRRSWHILPRTHHDKRWHKKTPLIARQSLLENKPAQNFTADIPKHTDMINKAMKHNTARQTWWRQREEAITSKDKKKTMLAFSALISF